MRETETIIDFNSLKTRRKFIYNMRRILTIKVKWLETDIIYCWKFNPCCFILFPSIYRKYFQLCGLIKLWRNKGNTRSHLPPPQDLLTISRVSLGHSINLINSSFMSLEKQGLANPVCRSPSARTCLHLWLKLKCFLPHSETGKPFISLKRWSICKILSSFCTSFHVIRTCICLFKRSFFLL